jgi:hypothetical protein
MTSSGYIADLPAVSLFKGSPTGDQLDKADIGPSR